MLSKQQISRQSNIELLRVVAMVMIILHHYCIFGGFVSQFDFTNITPNTLLIQFFSLGGKIGVNIFFLITGYFMIEKNMKIEKVWRLIYQIFTINLLVCIFLLSIGESYSKRDLLAVIPLISDVPVSFISNYVFVYLISPVINKCLLSISKKEFDYLLIVLLCYYCILNSFLFQNTFQYASWGVIMYSVGAYIKLFGIANRKNIHWGWISIGIIIFCWIGMLSLDYLSLVRGKISSTLWREIYTDANKITVFCAGVSIFLYFKNLKIKYYPLINYIGGGTLLGVLLIHNNGRPMIQWLWTKFLNAGSYFTSDYLWLHMLLSVTIIFLVCIVLEKLRCKLFDPIFDNLYSNFRTKRAKRNYR